MPAILDFDFARPASYDPTDMVGVACVRSLASSAHPGTYVGQDGLIKLAPHNLLTYSEQFDNAAWTKRGTASVSADATPAPDGGSTADLLTGLASSGNDVFQQVLTLPNGTPAAAAVWIKKVSATGSLAIANPTDTANGEWTVDLSLVGSGWEKITDSHPAVTVVAPFSGAASNGVGIHIFRKTGSVALSVYVWAAQVNSGATLLDYVKTTSAANGGTRIGWGPREPYQNLLLQTTLPGGGSPPTGWTVGAGSGSASSSCWGSDASAYTFTSSASRNWFYQNFTIVSNTTYSYSVKLETTTGAVALNDIIQPTSLPAGCTITAYRFDGVTQSASYTPAVAGIVSCTIGGTYTGGAVVFRIGCGTGANTTGTVKLSRPNLNVGAQAYNWYPTTSAPVYVTPFDLVGNWECHGAMSEGLRTNEGLQSSTLSSGTWSKTGTTVTDLYADGPGGALTATRVQLGATIGRKVDQLVTLAGGTASKTVTQSVWLKSNTGSPQDIQIKNSHGGVLDNYLTVTATASWQRFQLTVTNSGSAGTGNQIVGLYNHEAVAKDILVWHQQTEQASSASSEIPTTTVAVTRNADAVSYTLSGSHATALSSQGTAVVEYRLSGSVPVSGDPDRKALSLDDGTSSNRVWIGTSSGANATRAIITAAGVAQAGNINTVGLAVGSRIVSAFSYATNNANLATNGVPVNNDASCTIPAVTKLGFGAASDGTLQLFGTIKRVTIFSTALTDAQVTNASTPVEPTAHWRTYDGTHRTASDTDKTVSCDIEADVDLDTAGENGVQRVEFYVSVNGALSSIATQTSRSQRTHNSTPAGANGFLTTWGYGITVDCSALAGGTITVDATVFSKLGSISYLPTLTIYNDTDGVDRRPSSAIVYYDYDLGDDTTGTGTFANPFKNPRAAMNSLSGDIGGATIRAKGRTVGMTPSSSYSASGWSTSGKWALTFEAVGTDKTWQRLTPGTFSDPQDYILGTSGAAQVRMRFKDFEFVGPGPTLYVNGPNAQIDEVNCLVRSHKWTPADTNAHVDYEQYGSGGADIALNGTSRGVRNSWGGQWKGVARGPAGYTSLFNFSIDKFLGIALQTSNDLGVNPLISNGELHFIRYTAGRLDGLIQTNPNFSQLAGANVTVSVQASGPHTGKMRIEATNGTPNDFGTAAGHLVGSTRWGVTVSSATSGANNGTFAALEGGLNGFGRPYCILDNASAVAEVGSAGFNMDTGTLVGGNRYIDVIHTDGLQMYGPHVGAAFTNVRAYDCENMRSWVGSNLALTRCVLKNLSDGSHSSLRTCAFDFDNGPVILKDCIFSFLSINSNTVNFAGSFAGTNFVDVVFGNGNAVPTVGTFIHSCHFIAGASPGTNPSTGAWFNTEPGVTPFSYTPAPGNLGTASGLQDAPPFWYHTGAVAASRGAWKNVATGNWSTSLGSGGGSTAKIPYLGLGVRVGFL